MKPENLRANNETGVKDTDSSCSSFHHHTIGDRFELPSQVRQALFERDCEEIPLSENQLGYFSDLETLEWFWEIVKDESDRTKEVSPPSPSRTPPGE